MKTTIKIADPLLNEARKLAAQEGVTLQTLVERGLSRVLTETKTVAPFQLQRAAFQGKGLQAEFANASWDKLRAASYQDHGG